MPQVDTVSVVMLENPNSRLNALGDGRLAVVGQHV